MARNLFLFLHSRTGGDDPSQWRDFLRRCDPAGDHDQLLLEAGEPSPGASRHAQERGQEPFLDLGTLRETLQGYEFVVILGDRWLDPTTDPQDLMTCVKGGLHILSAEGEMDQVLFLPLLGDQESRLLAGLSVSIPPIRLAPRVDLHQLRRKIQSVFRTSRKTDEPRDTVTDARELARAKGEYHAMPNFRLEPSIVRVRSWMAPALSLPDHPHGAFTYGQALEETGFRSCSLAALPRKDELLRWPSSTRVPGDVTVVTGFIDLKTRRAPKRPSQVYDYLQSAGPTLSLRHPMVIFASAEVMEPVRELRSSLGLLQKTHLVEVSLEDLYLFEEQDRVRACVRGNAAPYNDPFYVMAVNTRYQHLQRAIATNPFQTEWFAWVDFGASHIVSFPPDSVLSLRRSDCVRIGWIARYHRSEERFAYNHRALGGGVFAAHRQIMSEFAALHDREFRALMKLGYCINDDKLLFLLFEKYPYLFDTFFSDYKGIARRMGGDEEHGVSTAMASGQPRLVSTLEPPPARGDGERLAIESQAGIELGSSKENRKVFELRSPIPLAGTLHTYPLATTRTRYQHPEMFGYTLTPMASTDDDAGHAYRLVVEREAKPNCLTTASLFWDDGWSFPLRALHLEAAGSALDLRREETIARRLPPHYGSLSVARADDRDLWRVGIVMPVFGRAAYLERCLASLLEVDLRGCVLVLVDESLTKVVDKDKHRAHALVQGFQHPHASTILIAKSRHGNMFDSLLAGFDLLTPSCEHLMALDSDTIHRADLVDASLQTHTLVAADFPGAPIIVSGFNTANGGRHGIIETRGSYVLKESVGGCHMAFTAEAYRRHLRCSLVSHKWDSNIVRALKAAGGTIACTRPSVVDHISSRSSGHRVTALGDEQPDRAIDFPAGDDASFNEKPPQTS